MRSVFLRLFSCFPSLVENENRLMRSLSCLSVYPSCQILKAWTNFCETWYVYIMAPEPISTACFINTCHQSVCLCVYLPIVARQGLGKNITAAMNRYIRNKIEKLLDTLFSMRSASYQGTASNSSFTVTCVFIAARTCLLSRCLAEMISWASRKVC
jgi:hypothetical protein